MGKKITIWLDELDINLYTCSNGTLKTDNVEGGRDENKSIVIVKILMHSISFGEIHSYHTL